MVYLDCYTITEISQRTLDGAYLYPYVSKSTPLCKPNPLMY